MYNEPSNSDDTIDSRAIISRISELEDSEEDGTIDDDEREELKVLKALAEEAEGYAADWRHGATLIREDYLPKYAEQLANDLGAIPDNAQWPLTCIDWDAAAHELKDDYTSLDYDGVTYWVRM